jgi:hypothetical protein
MWDSKGEEGKHFGTHLVVSGSSGTCERVLRLVQAKHARFQLVVLIPRAACTTTAALVMRGWRSRRRRHPHTIGLHTRHLSPPALRCASHTLRSVQPLCTAHRLHIVTRAPGVTDGIRSGCPSPRVHAPIKRLPSRPHSNRFTVERDQYCAVRRTVVGTRRITSDGGWACSGRVEGAQRRMGDGGGAMTLLASHPW